MPRSETVRRPKLSRTIPVGCLKSFSGFQERFRLPEDSYWATRPATESVTKTVSEGPIAMYGSV